VAEEIKIPCRLAPHTANNANAYYGRLDMTNDLWQPFGLVLPDDKDSRVSFVMASPIPTNINATPAGIFRFIWVPGGTGSVKLFLDATVATLDSTSLDPASATLSTSVTEAAAVGANVIQTTDIALTSLAASLVSNRVLFGWIERKASTDVADSVEAPIVLLQCLFVANT